MHLHHALTPILADGGFFDMATNAIAWGKLIGFGVITLICIGIIGAAAITRSLPKIVGALILVAFIEFAAGNLLLLGDTAKSTYDEIKKQPPVTIQLGQ
jgi:hypothetical protein